MLPSSRGVCARRRSCSCYPPPILLPLRHLRQPPARDRRPVPRPPRLLRLPRSTPPPRLPQLRLLPRQLRPHAPAREARGSRALSARRPAAPPLPRPPPCALRHVQPPRQPPCAARRPASSRQLVPQSPLRPRLPRPRRRFRRRPRARLPRPLRQLRAPYAHARARARARETTTKRNACAPA
ncbi:unnamed protein product [Closterium sp. NIES-53]